MKTGSIEKILSAHVLRGGVLYRGGVIRGRDGENHRGCYMEEYCIIVYKHRNVSGGLYVHKERVAQSFLTVHNGRVSQEGVTQGKASECAVTQRESVIRGCYSRESIRVCCYTTESVTGGVIQSVLLHNGRVSQGVLLKGKHQSVLLHKGRVS